MRRGALGVRPTADSRAAAHLSAAGIVLAEGVDLEEISLKYEITGGYIRNAVLAALLSAVGRTPKAPRLTQASYP